MNRTPMHGDERRRRSGIAIWGAIAAALLCCDVQRSLAQQSQPTSNAIGQQLLRQTAADAEAKSRGCVSCHQGVTGMHKTKTVRLGCVDCHGGDPTSHDQAQAHVQPRYPEVWQSSANPVRSYTLLNHESRDFVRFVNPGDLRVAQETCGVCHEREVHDVGKSMMTHGCMLWGAALYNNGAVPSKYPRYGESYTTGGTAQRIYTWPPPTGQEMQQKLVLPFLEPLPRFEVTQPGNILRIFERGGRFRAEVGIPERLEEPGRPRERLSTRGLGTQNRTDPVFIGLQKTRLLDPTLNFLGTNDHAGDYRSSGCTACHVVYANDRSPVHSAHYARFGNRGLTFNPDPMIPQDEPGHPIRHEFTLSIPTSQCIVCHVHPGTTVMNSYLGLMWWDNETDGELLYPSEQKDPTAEEYIASLMSNPNEAAARGLWSDPEFLQEVSRLNEYAQHTQFADFHGHGWNYSAVFKKDRKGRLLDHRGFPADTSNQALRRAMEPPTPEERRDGKQRDGVPVHLMDIHLEKGMHCVDCHFTIDSHGNGKLYGEVRAAIEIQCTDCHGTIDETIVERVRKTGVMPTTGPAAPEGGTNLLLKRTPFGRPRFEVQGGKLVQNSMVEPELQWEVVQTADTIDPQNDHYNIKSAMAKTVRFDESGQMAWGDLVRNTVMSEASPAPRSSSGVLRLAHENSNVSCIACHTSWNPSCFGCHLPQRANMKMPTLHNEGDISRNYTSYNFQTLRSDVFMLCRNGNVTGNRIGPGRSSCAIHVTSYNRNREAIYTQQQTISADGLSGIAFSSNVPHTVRGGPGMRYGNVAPGTTETKMCTDCHLSKENDNNAVLSQLLMLGTHSTNWIGKYCWVAAGEHGFEAVQVTEDSEPQAVIGSSLHKIAYPENYRHHIENGGILEHAHEHPGRDIISQIMHPLEKHEILAVQARGEYLYAACGAGGLRVFDIAFIDHKGFSERITSAPVSPLGQRFYVPTCYATHVASPATTAPDPTRKQRVENEEPAIPAYYGFLYVADKYEGLILVGAGTLLDGNPLNNFLKRDATFNPDGLLNGARYVRIIGAYAYVCCDAGLVVISLANAPQLEVTAVLAADQVQQPLCVENQFRYGFVGDANGIKVLDLSDLARPTVVGSLELPHVHSIYPARTYAYVAAGELGLVILDITNPEQPVIDQVYDANGCMNDVHDVKLGITNNSQFAYVADGKNGLRVVQLTGAHVDGNDGFSPRPWPRLIATYPLKKGGHALAISEGVDRDRAVDESGNQLTVFGRIGARPLSLEDRQRMLQHAGGWFRVSDDPFDAELYRFPQAAWEHYQRVQSLGTESENAGGAPSENAPPVPAGRHIRARIVDD